MNSSPRPRRAPSWHSAKDRHGLPTKSFEGRGRWWDFGYPDEVYHQLQNRALSQGVEVVKKGAKRRPCFTLESLELAKPWSHQLHLTVWRLLSQTTRQAEHCYTVATRDRTIRRLTICLLLYLGSRQCGNQASKISAFTKWDAWSALQHHQELLSDLHRYRLSGRMQDTSHSQWTVIWSIQAAGNIRHTTEWPFDPVSLQNEIQADKGDIEDLIHQQPNVWST